MTSPLIETKLHAPSRDAGLVERPRLTERLRRGAESRLTLLSAPPGFGKSTLIADWIATPRVPAAAIAWVSLDQGDNDPASFWAYVAASVTAAIGRDRSEGADGSGEDPPPFDLATFVNDLAASPGDVVIVLDDLHVIDSTEIHDTLALLIDRLPGQAHLVIATRSDPPLPLARLRARGELVEIRAADLRFTTDEAASYLGDAMGLRLTGDDIGVLAARTEGWIAALQLAALSMQGRDDIASFITSFAGDDRYIVDYLVDEVLGRQSAGTRSFLAHSSILDRLTGPLCDAVTGRDDGRAMLEALDRANLFMVPLDDQRRWYRYHHLFGDVLQARLFDEEREVVPDLHRRASAWYERHGEVGMAIRHALAAGDVDRAAGLIELAAHGLRQSRQEMTLRVWLDALPDEVFAFRPMLAIAHAGAKLSTGQLDGVEVRLADAERWVGAAHDERARADAVAAGMIVLDDEALGHLPSAIALYRAALARIHGDLPGTIAQARIAFEASGDDQPLERGAAAGLLALASWTSGDLVAAHDAWSEAVGSLAEAGHLADVLGCFIAMADIRIAQGDLRDARRTYERGLRLGAEGRPIPLRGTADMHVGISGLYLEWNNLAAAGRHLEASTALGEQMGLPQNAYRWRVAMSRLREAQGDLVGAAELLEDAERSYVSDFFPDVRPVGAMRTRFALRQGDLDAVGAWVAGSGVSADDDPSYLNEFEHITYARLLLARGRRGDRAALATAEGYLGRLLDAAVAGGRGGSVVEVLVVQALVRRTRGDRVGAATAIERALSSAEPEGYIRMFVDEGPTMSALLRETLKRGEAPDYVGGLLEAFDERPASRASRQPLIEPLSERELDVMRLLATDLDGPDIARELDVSLNTMRTHTKNIYAKLGVNSRRAAVRRAADLELLARARDH